MKIILSLQYNTIQVIIISLLAFSMPYIAAKETGALVNIKSSKNATKDIEKNIYRICYYWTSLPAPPSTLCLLKVIFVESH